MPLLAASCWFAVGELIAWNRPPLIFLFIAILLTFLLTFAGVRWSLRTAVIPLAAAWMAIGCLCSEIHPLPPTQPTLTRYADGLSRKIRGRITRVRELPPPQKDSDHDKESGWEPGKEDDDEASGAGLLSVDIQVNYIEEVTPDISRMVPASGGVRISLIANKATKTVINDRVPTFRCGNVIEAPMRIKLPERYRDPGAWQYADYLLAQGISAHASVRASKIALLDDRENNLSRTDNSAQLQCKIDAAQSWASKRLSSYVQSRANRALPGSLQLNSNDAGMLNAMLFGDRAGLNSGQRIGFERTGSFHLFVVSGMHVGLLAGMVFWLARRLKLHDWVATLITIALTLGYALLTGFGAPVQRAFFMATIFLLTRLLSRDRNAMNALGAASLGVLAWSPNALFEASFQMTFLAVIAIAGIAIPLAERSFLSYTRASAELSERWRDTALPPRIVQFRVMLRLWSEAIAAIAGKWAGHFPSLLTRTSCWTLELALIGTVAEMIMVLPMAVYFHRATMFAVPANIFSVPLVAVLAPTAVVAFCASLISPWAAMLPGAATSLLLHGVSRIIGRLSAAHGADLRIPGPVWWIGLLSVGIWFFCSWAVRRSRRLAWAAVALLPLVALMVLWPERAVLSLGSMEVTAIDVGQGDSLLVVAPNGATMLVDAGGPVGGVAEVAEAASRFDIGEEIVSPYLWSRRLRRLDVLVLSHAHSDHMGGMYAVMRNFRPHELWVSIDPDSRAYRALLAGAKDLGVEVRHLVAGNQLAWNGTQVTVLAPEAGYNNPNEPMNDDSLVMRLQYGGGSVLLEGDAEGGSEREMLAHGRVAHVTLLKVGHHGSRTSTSEAFLMAAGPQDAVVSAGKGNTFGHPRYEVINRIAAAGSKLYRTDEFGLTTFLLGRDGGIREIVGASDQ